MHEKPEQHTAWLKTHKTEQRILKIAYAETTFALLVSPRNLRVKTPLLLWKIGLLRFLAGMHIPHFSRWREPTECRAGLLHRGPLPGRCWPNDYTTTREKQFYAAHVRGQILNSTASECLSILTFPLRCREVEQNSGRSRNV